GRIDHHTFANQAHFRISLDSALSDITSGYSSNAADLESIADNCPAQVHDFFARLELAFKSRPDVVRQVINDVVFADLDPLFLRQCQRAIVGHDVETNDDGVFG